MLLLVPSISQRVSASSSENLGNFASSASQLGGVTISGLVSTENAFDTVSVKLFQLQNNVIVEVDTAVITIPDDAKPGLFEYTFPNVEPGIYTLEARKPQHLSYINYWLVVGSVSFTIENTINLYVGDINNDGQIDGKDLMLLSTSYGKTGDNLAADLDGNGEVNDIDIDLLVTNYGKSTIYIHPPNMT